jgi:hypothetical protein
MQQILDKLRSNEFQLYVLKAFIVSVRSFVCILLALNQFERLVIAFKNMYIVRSQYRLHKQCWGVSVYSVVYFMSGGVIQNGITHANEIYVYMYVKIISNDSHEDS